MPPWIQGTRVGDGLLPDRFCIRQPLGQGAQGQVYLAWDRLHERDVALKRLESDADCLREARALARVRHPNVVTVYELVHQVDPPYLVMQYVEGEELELCLQRTGALSPTAALVVARSVAAALAAAHAAGVLHRDLKPANVMLQDDGEVTLIDFGIARGGGPEEEGRATVLGTPLYLAPEVLAGQPADEQSEIYAVGVMLYRMLTGRHPYEAETLEQLQAAMQTGPAADVRLYQPTVPVPLADVVAACLAPRASRYTSAVTLLRELERVGQRGVRALPAAPYIGLLPLTTEARGVFFGREEEVARVLGRLRAASTVTLVGASGAGKSSLAMAGVAAAVLAGDLDRRRWRVERMTPGQRPLSRLAQCLAGCTGHDPEGGARLAHLERELRQSPGRWWRLLDTIEQRARGRAHEAGGERPRGLLLLVDQLEELVTLCSDEAEQRGLGQALCGSLAADGGVRVLVTARDDFLARLGAVEGLAEVLETIHIVRPLDGEGLRAAVVEPARAFGFTFEDDVMVEQIVTELAGRSGTMPLLGFALQRLWDQRDEQRRIIPRAALDRMGGIGAALARAADEVVEALTRQGLRRQTRQVLLKLLTPQGTKRSRVLEDLLGSADSGSREVVSRLREARLVTGGDTALELAHEALASEWSLLRRWVDESRAWRELAADALHAARRWQQRGRVSDLLWRGAPLQEVRALPLDLLSTQALEFVEASRRHARRQHLLRWLLLGVLGLAALATAGIYVRHLKLQRDMARRQTLAERQALTAQRELARAEQGRGRAEEERRQLLEAWVKDRKQLLADLNRTEQSGLRQHILRRLTEEDPPLRQLPRPVAAAGVDVCLFGPAHDLSMSGDWASKTKPVALTLREAGHVIGCEYPYVRAAFRGAARHGLLQYAGDLPRPTLDRLVGQLRRRFPGLELKRVAGKRLFRTVDILLPD